MRPSLSQPSLGTHPFGDTLAEERLRGLDRQQLADRLTWLSWWSPGTFTVVMDYMQYVDDLAADGDPDDDPDDLAPHCAACGGEVGIFVRCSLEWQHYADPPVMPCAARESGGGARFPARLSS
jgi:hypothetical protein